MTDTGQPPKRTFEPPPWEKEQFDELARTRAEAELADAAVDELAALATSPVPPPDVESELDLEAEPEPPVHQGGGPAATGVDERRVAAMLVQLSGEEVSALTPIKTASRIVAGIVIAVGTAIIVIAGLIGAKSASSGPLAGTSAGVGVVIGGALIGAGAWLWLRAKR